MTPAQIALACGVMFSPPPEYDTMPLPVDARVVEVPFNQISGLCDHLVDRAHYRIVYACTRLGTMVSYVPTFKTYPGSRECWLELKRHETAHLKGWVHP